MSLNHILEGTRDMGLFSWPRSCLAGRIGLWKKYSLELDQRPDELIEQPGQCRGVLTALLEGDIEGFGC